MQKKDIKFLRINYLRGPNMWTYRPVLEAWIDIGVLEDFPSNTLPGFYDRLTAWLPSLVEHRCGVGERGGFLMRLREGTWAGHILEHVTIELQNLAGMQSGFGKARETSTRGVYKVVVRSRHEEVSRFAMMEARELILAAIEDRPYDVKATVIKLQDMVDSLCLGPSTGCIVDAATDRRIPHIRLNEGNLVQLGYGSHQRRIWTAESDLTSAIGESISRDKNLTKSLLQSCGVPVPEGEIVESAEEAWEAAEDIGLPVVVKPTDGNHGRGVSTNLTTREEVEAAYAVAIEEGSEVIVERFIPGHEHRLLVVGKRVVAAARGEIAGVVGDGKSTILELIESQINSDPRRGEAEEYPLSLIIVDREPVVKLELKRQGFTPESVPPAGKEVLIQRNGNVSIDITDQVHPEVAEAAALAARIVGLDIAGIDLVAQDISRPLEEQGGAIVEVNAGPGLLMHLKPAEGEPRPVGQAIVDHLFPEDESGRIPIVGITGSRGKTKVARLVARLLNLSGKQTGLACSDGLFFGTRQVEKGYSKPWESGRKILLNRTTQAAVFENSPRAILADGLVYDRCQVGVVTNILNAEGLADFYVHNEEQVYNVLRTQVDVVLPDGYAVLNAADPLVVEMAPLCDGGVIFYALTQLSSMGEHLAEGGRAVFVRDEQIILAAGLNETVLVNLNAIPMVRDGVGDIMVENLLAAVATAWALDIPIEIIRAGTEGFDLQLAGIIK
ncbi:cyanophycin synthetase [Novimethylophilus kurashikiensis]|uniref:Cyanophycin synthetase n=1 Tax=Novimethylophilus kurashikiensis TaxID=1825523 RepID=A0A2R5F3U0_9PROT|nr:cyanophycin synthetase [Novimethylophilus kurashikiensis]GBG13117.1 cyanophycin synthetase [Novimethylophilus kurashikiensis]